MKVYIVTSEFIIDYKKHPEYNYPTMAFKRCKDAEKESSRRCQEIQAVIPEIFINWQLENKKGGFEFFKDHDTRPGNHFTLETVPIEVF